MKLFKLINLSSLCLSFVCFGMENSFIYYQNEQNLENLTQQSLKNLRDVAQDYQQVCDAILVHAITLGNIEKTILLLDEGAQINGRTSQAVPLILAVLGDGENHLKIAEILLERGAGIERVDSKGRTALWAAVNKLKSAEEDAKNILDNKMLRLLLQKKANVNYVNYLDEEGPNSVLGAAFKSHRGDFVLQLLAKRELALGPTHMRGHKLSPLEIIGTRVSLDHFKPLCDFIKIIIQHPNFNEPLNNELGQALFFIALKEKNLSLGRLLLQKNIPLVALSSSHYTSLVGPIFLTPLQESIHQKWKEGVELLLLHGADPNFYVPGPRSVLQKHRHHDAPLEILLSENYFDEDIFKLLISHPSLNVNITDDDGATVLHRFPIKLWKIILPPLVARGININAQANSNFYIYYGAHLYFRALIAGNWELVHYLERLGADTTLRDRDNNNALLTASRGDNPLLIKYLIEKGEDINWKNNADMRLLIHTVIKGQYELAKELITEHNADPCFSFQGETFLDRVRKNKKVAAAKQLSQLISKICAERKKPKKEKVLAETGEQLLQEQRLKREEYEKSHGVQALVNKTFFSLIEGKSLNLGAKMSQQLETSIRFVSENNGVLKAIITFIRNKKEESLELFLKPNLGEDGGVKDFSLVNPKEPTKVLGSSGYNLSRDKTHQKDKSGFKIRNGIISFEAKLNVVIHVPGKVLDLSGQMRVQDGGKPSSFKFCWHLEAQEGERELTEAASAPVNTSKKVEVKAEPEISPKKFYAGFLEIPGRYDVLLNNELYATADIPPMRDDDVKIRFVIPLNTLEPEHHLLHTKIDYSVTNQLQSFIPQGKDNKNGDVRFMKARTTFDGLNYTPPKKKIKGRAPLCFESVLFLEPRFDEQNQEVVFRAHTTKGELRLVKTGLLIDNEEMIPQIPEDMSSDEERDYQGFAVAGPHEIYYLEQELTEEVEEEVEHIEQPEAPIAAAPRAYNKKSREQEEPYIDWKKYGLIESRLDADRAAKHRRENWESIQEWEKRKARNPIKKELSIEQIPSPKFLEKKLAVEPRTHEIHHTNYLSPLSSYNDCELVNSSVKESTWFGQGFVLENGRLKKIDGKKLVLGMKNWSDYPLIAKNAAWGSLMASDLGENNFYFGKNVHLSYHEQMYGNKKIKYINISHHYKFELQKNESTGDYFLYDITPGKNEQIVYILSNWTKNKKRNQEINESAEIIATHARNFINWQPCWQKKLEHVMDWEIMKKRAAHIRDELMNNDDEFLWPLNKKLSFRPEKDGKGILNSEIPCRWDLYMINDNTAVITVDFIDNYGRHLIKNKIFTVNNNAE